MERLTADEREMFKRLREHRLVRAEIIMEDPAYTGIKTMVVDKYSDSAHFVYELLQNADDVGATKAKIELFDDKIVFIHNGTKHFTLSPVETEGEDRQKRKNYGDINAITSIGASTKTTNKDTIGRFGIGFKSVFQYTSTPEIYDVKYWFAIERFMVPKLIEKDYPGRESDETIFVLPFNTKEKTKEKSFSEIRTKLNELIYPNLFLTNLKIISFNVPGDEAYGVYEKEVVESQKFDNTEAEQVKYTFVGSDKDTQCENFWFFNRASEEGYRYSVGFLVKNGKLEPINRPAFCFFSTQVVTNLNFIIHAPFLLTDGREGIKAGEKHNQDMIDLLANLAADAMVYLRMIGEAREERLISDNIVKIVPTDESAFSKVGGSEKISFLPFYEKILYKFQNERLIPTGNGYAYKENAYWADNEKLTRLFGESELAEICDNPNAVWGFKSLSRGTETKYREYIDLITRTFLSDEVLVRGRRSKEGRTNDTEPIKGIDEAFTERRSNNIDWLCKFYEWASSNNEKIKACKTAPIFLDSDRRAARAFEGKKQELRLFRPSEGMDGKCRMILPELYARAATRELADKMKITEYLPINYIENNMDKWKGMSEAEKRELLHLAFRYWTKCSDSEKDKLVETIKGYRFILGYSIENKTLERTEGENLYYPDRELIEFFKASPQVKFVATQKYAEDMNLDEKNKDRLRHFLREFGVNELPKCERRDKQVPGKKSETEYVIDGMNNAIQFIVTKKDAELSLNTWKILCELNSRNELEKILKKTVKSMTNGKRDDDKNPSSTYNLLRKEKWLIDKEGKFNSPENIFQCDMDERYGIKNQDTSTMALLNRLEIRKNSDESMYDIQSRKNNEFMRLLNSKGYTIERLLDMIQKEDEKEARKRSRAEQRKQGRNVENEYYDEQDDSTREPHSDINRRGENVEKEYETRINSDYSTQREEDDEHRAVLVHALPQTTQRENTIESRNKFTANSGGTERAGESDTHRISEDSVTATSTNYMQASTTTVAESAENRAAVVDRPIALLSDADVTREYRRRSIKKLSHRIGEKTAESIVKGVDQVYDEIIKLDVKNNNVDELNEEADDVEERDDDEYMPRVISFYDKIEREKKKSANTLKKIGRYSTLNDAMIKLEEEGRYSFLWFKTLLEMEELSKEESAADRKEITVAFGGVRKDEETDRTLILRNSNRFIPQSIEELPELNLILKLSDGKSKEIKLEAANVKSYELHVKMKSAEEIDGIDLSLVEKATIRMLNPSFLLKELKEEFCRLGFPDDYDMQANLPKDIKFIFGPPGTGKTTRLAEKTVKNFMERAGSGKRMLILAPTNKAADVIVRKILDNDYCCPHQNWLVRFGTTNDDVVERSGIYRNAEIELDDFERVVLVTTIARFPYDSLKEGDYIRERKWDKIVIDEASMVSLASVVYLLYKKRSSEFVIAGDPFQIKPIVAVEEWSEENIYTLVGLESFDKKKTKYGHTVISLTEQYRSVPAIGNLYSKYKYKGLIENQRTAPQLKLNIGNIFDCRTLNIIRFPVKKYESVYMARRLNGGSPYQAYSALFTYEFVCRLARLISKNNQGQLKLSIGVIAPYRAQADIVDKLILGANLPEEITVRVGTIHSFQGDECEIIIAMFNTPPQISQNPNLFLNKDEIINVSISRAKDYLFVVMPDEETDGVENLKKLMRIREYMSNEEEEFREFSSSDIERLMFDGKGNFIEGNTFATGHQDVNVYRRPEKRYEIRSADTAIDVQVYEG